MSWGRELSFGSTALGEGLAGAAPGPGWRVGEAQRANGGGSRFRGTSGRGVIRGQVALGGVALGHAWAQKPVMDPLALRTRPTGP